MIWKNLISFTDKNKPYRFKVATSPLNLKESYLINIMTDQIDEFGNKIEGFEFIYNTREHNFIADLETQHKPLLLISEQMEELVRDGQESW